MIPSLNTSRLSAASTSRAMSVDDKRADNDAIPTFVRSQGRAEGISKSWVSAGKGRFSPDQGLMLDEDARALVAQELIMRKPQHLSDDTFKFHKCCRLEGIIPALESAHALAEVFKRAPTLPKDHLMVVNLSGRGDKDMQTVMHHMEHSQQEQSKQVKH